jgi:hypothetical protein
MPRAESHQIVRFLARSTDGLKRQVPQSERRERTLAPQRRFERLG